MDYPLIPRRALFGNPECRDLKISPDGTRLAWLAPWNGVMNLWVSPRDAAPGTGEAVLTHDAGRGVPFYFWSYHADDLIYFQDQNGDENWQMFSLSASTGVSRPLTPFPGTTAVVLALSPHVPGEALIGLNRRRADYHDVYRIDLATGALSLVYENDRFAGFHPDHQLNLRLAFAPTPEGGSETWERIAGEWRLWETLSPEDAMTSEPVGFSRDGGLLYRKDSRGRNTSALYEVDMTTKTQRLLAEDARADAEWVLTNDVTRQVEAVAFCWERREWTIFDAGLKGHFAVLATVASGDFYLTGRSLDERWWSVVYLVDNDVPTFYLYDTTSRAARRLRKERPDLDGFTLARMHSVTLAARDGLPLVCYYTRPIGATGRVPLVLVPHGGPWWRDSFGPSPFHQWLANRGYAALSVNFRSSTGFGKAFLNAGNHEWGGKILEDQLDAVQWCIDQGWADAERLAVMGGSFGGYSTLAQLAFHPEVFRCGVDIVGPANLITLLETVPEYWKPELDMMTARVGDHRTPEGRELLKRHSPLTKAHEIRRPLIIAQGANDPRVKRAESDQIVAAMRQSNIPVTYILFPDEGHGFVRPENKLALYALVEPFFAEHLGGRAEPTGDDLQGSSYRLE